MEKVTKILAIFFVVGVIIIVALMVSTIKPKETHAASTITFWKYQCIDTMKISRDDARKWKDKVDLQQNIDWEMQTIKGLGANCVAIDTPYDAEFMPYLQKWVTSARYHNLHIWFRGNFAGWEQWFNYPKITSTEMYLNKLKTFIISNSQLFEDGDIFTGAPEAENGGPFDQVEKNEYPDFRAFLIDQHTIEQQSFKKINKNVEINWQSMNGGLAKRMLDQHTIDTIGHTVTIDHYIKDSKDMGIYIRYFATKFKSKVIIGEFGAPIPEINGSMTEDEQAAFVNKLMQELVANRDNVRGINYWDLYDGSTALMNPDQTPRKVAAIIKRYYSPAVVEGQITNQLQAPLENVTIKSNDGSALAVTDRNGHFSFPTAADAITIIVSNGENINTLTIKNIDPSQKITRNIVLMPQNIRLLEKIQIFFYDHFKR